MGALLAASDRELSMPSSHACAKGRDVWTLITNDIDHERIHTAPGPWTYRVVAKHVLRLEQDSLKTIASDHATRSIASS